MIVRSGSGDLLIPVPLLRSQLSHVEHLLLIFDLGTEQSTADCKTTYIQRAFHRLPGTSEPALGRLHCPLPSCTRPLPALHTSLALRSK